MSNFLISRGQKFETSRGNKNGLRIDGSELREC